MIISFLGCVARAALLGPLQNKFLEGGAPDDLDFSHQRLGGAIVTYVDNELAMFDNIIRDLDSVPNKLQNDKKKNLKSRQGGEEFDDENDSMNDSHQNANGEASGAGNKHIRKRGSKLQSKTKAPTASLPKSSPPIRPKGRTPVVPRRNSYKELLERTQPTSDVIRKLIESHIAARLKEIQPPPPPPVSQSPSGPPPIQVVGVVPGYVTPGGAGMVVHHPLSAAGTGVPAEMQPYLQHMTAVQASHLQQSNPAAFAQMLAQQQQPYQQ